ncbi:aminotransferase class I/II-fold pyridoxal phosphate-dependent enzyme [Actinomadura chibensis]|uniref:Aminotransferase class I/II-fold pyridoxal phosphate-dependent enzyme n=1 Tax=Actinomadura chibensis TaxID=392828 RepID=A0A5D0NLP6_9ACTN|nr:aminotransferase class I/II-fold pyridoxal phosphate-dependent enzyme [Actinomadura chibensis]TYB45413.1 aminotransferase class I/II-fold pyridoxal phosphate-dependent enzyme [Actinomadura chibensis]
MPTAKSDVSELAIFGGPPAFDRPLVTGTPSLPARDEALRRITASLDGRHWTNGGPLVAELERRFAELTGVRHCLAVANGTVAIEVLARALGLSGEVIVPSFTYVATAHALRWHGITPVFCDIDAATGNLDPARVRALVSPRTSAIMGVHLWGRPCDVPALEEIAAEHGIPLLFDAAHAAGCRFRGRPLGALGRAATFSFHPTKAVNSFEGGAITTDDDDLADRIRAMRNFGNDAAGTVRGVGTNARMNEICAAMAITSLAHLDEVMDANRRNHVRYREALADVPGLTVRVPGPGELNNLQYAVIELDEGGTDAGTGGGPSRDDLLAALRAENVLAKTYFHPGCHRLAPYRDRPARHAPAPLPRTESLGDRVLVMPTGTAVRPDEVSRVCDVLRLAVRAGRRLTAAHAGPADR